MEDYFKKLQKQSQNSVDNLVMWMKECKIIDGVKVTEEKARKMFADVVDVKNVEFSTFKAAVVKLAAEQQKNVEAFMKTLADEGPRVLNAASAAANAFKEAYKKK